MKRIAFYILAILFVASLSISVYSKITNQSDIASPKRGDFTDKYDKTKSDIKDLIEEKEFIQAAKLSSKLGGFMKIVSSQPQSKTPDFYELQTLYFYSKSKNAQLFDSYKNYLQALYNIEDYKLSSLLKAFINRFAESAGSEVESRETVNSQNLN